MKGTTARIRRSLTAAQRVIRLVSRLAIGWAVLLGSARLPASEGGASSSGMLKPASFSRAPTGYQMGLDPDPAFDSPRWWESWWEGWRPQKLVFRHGQVHDPGRHRGRGSPLEGSSWLNRPWSVGWLLGGLFTDEVIESQVAFHDDVLGGYRLGWDFDHYFGLEARIAYGYPGLTNLNNALPLGGGRAVFNDLHLMFYPWGDSRWRPFAFLGGGVAQFRLQNVRQGDVKDSVVYVPMGMGVKWMANANVVLRFDAIYDITFAGDEISGMSNLSLAGGVEFRFGGRRVSYYPWHPSIHMLW